MAILRTCLREINFDVFTNHPMKSFILSKNAFVFVFKISQIFVFYLNYLIDARCIFYVKKVSKRKTYRQTDREIDRRIKHLEATRL